MPVATLASETKSHLEAGSGSLGLCELLGRSRQLGAQRRRLRCGRRRVLPGALRHGRLALQLVQVSCLRTIDDHQRFGPGTEFFQTLTTLQMSFFASYCMKHTHGSNASRAIKAQPSVAAHVALFGIS